MSPLLLTTGISGGEATTSPDVNMCHPIIWIITAIIFLLSIHIGASKEDSNPRVAKICGILSGLAVTLPIFAPYGVFFCKDSTVEHAPYFISGKVVKVEQLEDKYYRPTVTLDGGEQVKVHKSIDQLSVLVNSPVTLKCDYKEMPEKKITNSTGCEIYKVGSDPAPAELSN